MAKKLTPKKKTDTPSRLSIKLPVEVREWFFEQAAELGIPATGLMSAVLVKAYRHRKESDLI